MQKYQPLKNRFAIVTGAAQGLGQGIAVRLASDGATVICVDILDASATTDMIASTVGDDRAWAAQVDVSITDEVENLVKAVLDRHGAIDILVNNAAVMQPIMDVTETDDATIDRVLAVNLRGVIAFSRPVGRHMRERRYGRIINISSQVGKVAWPGIAVYSAAKAAVIALTQAMGLELAPFGVFVNSICPGTMDTAQARYTFQNQAVKVGRLVEDLVREKQQAMPLRRLGSPQDAAAMVAWLASDEATFTVGAALNLTGGEFVGF
jgi:NAD(P)-dependent dehydrogenase (short-subunit alcohol dehydrogenase family)